MPDWARARSGPVAESGDFVPLKQLVDRLRLKLFGKGAA
jgi:hypothetical protein